MICAHNSDGELTVSESGHSLDLSLGMMVDGGLRVVVIVVVGGRAVATRYSQVHPTGVLAGTAAIRGHSPTPAPTIARGASVGVLQGLVFAVWIRVGQESPYSGDLLGHWDGMLMWKIAPAMFGREQSLYP